MMWNAVRQKLGVSARARLLTVAGLCAVVWTLAAYNPKQEARRTMQPEQVLQGWTPRSARCPYLCTPILTTSKWQMRG
jgi:hypothetical protein